MKPVFYIVSALGGVAIGFVDASFIAKVGIVLVFALIVLVFALIVSVIQALTTSGTDESK
jgi:hypothetical protein